MKRPLAVIGFTYLAVLCVSAQFDVAVCVVLALLCAAAAVVLLLAFGPFGHRAVFVTVLCTAGAAFAVYALTWHLAYWPAAALSGRTAQVRGVVTEAPVQSGQSFYYMVKTDSIHVSGTAYSRPVMMRVKTQEDDITPFSHISFTAAFSLPSTGETDGFNSQAYYRSKGVYLFAAVQGNLQISAPTGFHPYALAIRLRRFLSSRLQERVSGVWGALSAGILIGDVSALPSWVKNDFTVTGISHILAVSGTQTSLIMQVLLLIFARLRMPRRAASPLTAAAVFLFMAVTGFSPSVSRAGIMSLLYLGGLMLGREAEALNSLGISVLILCLLNPFAATDTGMLLSFAATLGLVLVSGRCVHRMDTRLARLPQRAARLLRFPGAVLCETLGATLLTLPVILLTFRQLSLVTFLSNVVEVPLSLLATLASAAAALLPDGMLSLWLVKPVALLLRLCCAAMIGFAHVLADLPFATVSTDYGFVYLTLFLAVAVWALCWRMRGKGADRRAAAVCVAFTMAVGMASHAAATNGVLEFAALPVGDGNCTVMLLGGHAVLLDLSGYDASYLAARWLKTHNVGKVDALILPVWDRNRQEAVDELKESVRIQVLALPAAYRSSAGNAARFVSSAASLKWGGATLTLYPSKNDKTLLTVVRYGKSRAVLTGGVPADPADYELPQNALAAGQLFYGGKLSDVFVRSVSPKYAVFSGESTWETAASGGMLGAQGCTVRSAGDSALLSRTRGGAFLSVP